jgi:hypothetical protein
MTATGAAQRSRRRQEGVEKFWKVAGPIALVVLGLFVLYQLVSRTYTLATSGEGATACREEFARRPEGISRDSFAVVRTVWTRFVDGHRVAALVMQPKNLQDARLVTVVCYFRPVGDEATYAVERIDYLDGDRSEALKRISRTSFGFLRDAWLWGEDKKPLNPPR